MTKDELKQIIRNVPDWPQPGIQFKDISPILASPKAMDFIINEFSKHMHDVDVIVGPDARGFLFGTPLAFKTKKPFIMARKPGKLPGEVLSESYKLEYGENTIEILKGALKKGQRVAIVDDLLATGGTTLAIKKLIESQGAIVSKILFVIELEDLNGKKALQETEVISLIKY